MSLTRTEREKIQDSKLKLQSAANTLSQVDPRKIDHFEELQECLQDAHISLEKALRRSDISTKKN